MSKNIQIYINNKKTDTLNNSLSYSITKQITDFNDISKRTGSFSYTINIPITKNNKNIFEFIDVLEVNNKFNKSKNYDCQLIVNDNTLIDGIFILTQITKDNYVGNIVNKFGDIFTLLGDKKLRDLNLPSIDFEGVMIPFNQSTNGLILSLTEDCLNKNLGFDFQALSLSYKSSTNGLLGSSIDYSNYYKTGLISYSNFPTFKNVNNKLNTITNSFNKNDWMPNVKLNKVIEQLFIDIGYKVLVENELLSDDNLILPFTGEEPEWNWKHLSKTYVYTDINKVDSITRFTTSPFKGQYIKAPFISSKIINYNFRKIKLDNTYKQYTDSIINLYDKSNYNFQSLNTSANIAYKISFTPTNAVKYDFNNNFSIYSPAPKNGQNTGWLYTVPADGTYEFDLEVEHNIITYNFGRLSTSPLSGDVSFLYTEDVIKNEFGYLDGYDGTAGGNKTWTYNSQERFHAGNMVFFVKENDFEIDNFINNYRNTFDYKTAKNNNYKNIESGKIFNNFKEESLIAYYHPLLRDLYSGGYNQNFENIIKEEESILVNTKKISNEFDSEEEKDKFMGFNELTTITEYDNQIYYNYNPSMKDKDDEKFNDNYTKEEQLRRKMVRLKRLSSFNNIKKVRRSLNYTVDGYYAEDVDNQPYTIRTNPLIPSAQAGGVVKFKFKTILAKGDQIRMYYATAQQFTVANIKNPAQIILPFPPFSTGYEFNPLMNYNDAFFDDMKINKLSIKCVDEKYSEKLKLANFLPEGTQKEFLLDYIKSNNLYFDINDNNIIFKKRGDFYSNIIQNDLTNRMLKDYDNIQKIDDSKSIKIGYKTDKTNSYYSYLNKINPVEELNKNNNIYLDNNENDITSTMFFTTFDRLFQYRKYNIIWDGGFTQDDNYTIINNIYAPSMTEGDETTIINEEAVPNYSKSNRILYYDNIQPISNTSGNVELLISNLPFKNIKFNKIVSNKGLLLNSNKKKLFEDIFNDLQDSSLIEWFCNMDDFMFSKIDLKKPILINNSLYYIQKIENYNPLNNKLTKLILLKL